MQSAIDASYSSSYAGETAVPWCNSRQRMLNEFFLRTCHVRKEKIQEDVARKCEHIRSVLSQAQLAALRGDVAALVAEAAKQRAVKMPVDTFFL